MCDDLEQTRETPATRAAEEAASDAFALGGASPAPAADRLAEQVAGRLAAILLEALAEHERRVVGAVNEAFARAERTFSLRETLGDDALVTRDELAAMLGVHPKTVATLVREGKLPPGGKVGAATMYSLGAARAIVKAAGGADAITRKGGRPAKKGKA